MPDQTPLAPIHEEPTNEHMAFLLQRLIDRHEPEATIEVIQATPWEPDSHAIRIDLGDTGVWVMEVLEEGEDPSGYGPISKRD